MDVLKRKYKKAKTTDLVEQAQQELDALQDNPELSKRKVKALIKDVIQKYDSKSLKRAQKNQEVLLS